MTIDGYVVALVIIPCFLMGLLCYFSIQIMLRKQLLQQKFQLIKENKKQSLPNKLQAYERFTLLLDRISLDKLLVRIAPLNDDFEAYKHLLIATIEQEFEHNSTQQIYVSQQCWNTITTAKSTVISQLHQLSADGTVTDAQSFRQLGLRKHTSISSANQVAQSYIRQEVAELFA